MSTHECRGCNAQYDSNAWRSLALVSTQGPDQLRDLFTEWPWSRDATLEVRRCKCGVTLAWLSAPRARATSSSAAASAS